MLFEWDWRDPDVVFVDGVAVPVGALDAWLRNDGYERPSRKNFPTNLRNNPSKYLYQKRTS